MVAYLLIYLLVIQLSERIDANGEKPTNAVIKDVILFVKNGEIKYSYTSTKICCEGKGISIVDALLSPQTTCTTNDILLELKYFFNFKVSFEESFTISCLVGYNGTISVKYKCISKVLECNPSCEGNNSTCVLTAEGSKCLVMNLNSNSTSSIAGYRGKYIGCFKISTASEEIEIYISKIIIPQECVKACQEFGYSFAVLGGIIAKCSCYQNIINLLPVAESNCLSACLYNPLYSCGNGTYKHAYSTGVVNTKCGKDPCPKGTFCVQYFDSYYCFCNETSKEKPKGCYGCLEGWFTSPDTNQCYIMVNNFTMRKLSSECKRLHGTAISDTSANLFFLGYLLDNISKNKSTADQSLLQLLIENSTHVMPICQRVKSPVNGTYPWTTWPSGSYGLPMPESGCPEGHSFEWHHGFYKQYTEHTNNQNKVSDSFHLFGEVTKEFVYRGFCIKMEESVGEWPNGQYCIYKKGTHCPSNMVEGELFWDDEDTNNTNAASGTLPEGMFKKDTQIFYCCTTGEINQDGILLPRDRPFYLFPYKSKRCQHVIGTESSLEYIQYDLENYFEEVGAAVAKGERHPYAEIVIPGLHLQIYYCYYKPIKSCGRPHHSDLLNHHPNKTYQVGEVVRYVCKDGYKNIGDEYDECLPSEHWSSITGPNCVDINECTNSHACHVKANCHNSIGSYSCKCNPGWIGNGQDCKVISCLSPTPPENGFFSDVLIKDEFAIGAHIFVKCYPNYLLIGSDSFVCLETGQWKNPFPVCVEKSLCAEQSYVCQSSYSYRSPINNLICSCKYVNKGNFTYVTNPTENTEPSSATLIAALTTGSLALFSMILVAIVFTLVKWRRRERRLRDFSLKTNASIYADIEEFKLNFNMNAKRESYCPYFSANTDAVLSWDDKPNLPPRISIFKSVSDSNCQSRQPNSPVSNFRRHSDFPSSDSFLLPPNQFLSTISHAKLKRSFPSKQYNGPNATTQDDHAPVITERRISNVPAFSMSIASQSCEDIGSLDECEEYIENPYIDMNTDQISIRSGNEEFERSLMTERYGQIPRNTLRISLRHRSYTVGNTDKIEAEKKGNKLNKRNCFSSHSLQPCSHFPQTHTCSFQHNFDPCNITCPNRGDEILIINSWEDTDEKLKFVGETDFSIRLKLASIMKKGSKDWKMSMEEFSSRLFRYRNRSKWSSGRKRSDTNPL